MYKNEQSFRKGINKMKSVVGIMLCFIVALGASQKSYADKIDLEDLINQGYTVWTHSQTCLLYATPSSEEASSENLYIIGVDSLTLFSDMVDDPSLIKGIFSGLKLGLIEGCGKKPKQRVFSAFDKKVSELLHNLDENSFIPFGQQVKLKK